MGTQEYGAPQKLSFDYAEEATAKLFNNINYQLVPTGIYNGFTLTKLSNTVVELSTGLCFIQDSENSVGTRIETGSSQNITVSSATPFIVLRFNWADAQNNFMDMLPLANYQILPNDLIVGRCIFDDSGSVMNTVFDYTRRSIFYTNKQKVEDSYLRVTPTEPSSNQVHISSGVLNSSKGNLLISGGIYPSGGLPATTGAGRIDLIYIDEDGLIQFLQGVAQAIPVAPRYGNRKVIAEIRRGASRNSIRGNEIFRVISSFDMNAITSDQLLVDMGARYSSTNVEDAFQELALSNFSFAGDKTFTDSVSINAAPNKVAFTARASSGYNAAEFKSFNGTTQVSIDQNGKMWIAIDPDISLTDQYTVFTTPKYREAINQIGGGTMTFKGAKTFSNALTLSVAQGTAPLTITSNTKVDNLNVDYLDGYHANTGAQNGTIPVQGGNASFNQLFATGRLRIPYGQPPSVGNGDIWYV